ncbi:Regulator of nonsense transcripts UPF3-like protein [Drosera capensis]
MKDPLNRTKVVVRHLPPSLTSSSFFEQIDARFGGRYNWSSFCDGKVSSKHQSHARAYINFNTPDDVFAFAEFFNGHVFVNEKGAQFKATVEYAPSQRVPKPNGKGDAREGTIFKGSNNSVNLLYFRIWHSWWVIADELIRHPYGIDPEYLEFLEQISKPAEHLPSADVQLERREAELEGVRESPIVTPLMEFIRRKRAGKSANQASSNIKISGRGSTSSSRKSGSGATKVVSKEKKYIVRSTGKGKSGKEKSTNISVPRGDNKLEKPSGERLVETEIAALTIMFLLLVILFGIQKLANSYVYMKVKGLLTIMLLAIGAPFIYQFPQFEIGFPDMTRFFLLLLLLFPFYIKRLMPPSHQLVAFISGTSSAETGEKKILLLKGKEQDIPENKGSPSVAESSSVLPLSKSTASYDASGRIIRGILLNKETPQTQSPGVHSEQRLQAEKGKRPPRPSVRSSAGGYPFNNESSTSADPAWKRPTDDKSGVNHQNGIVTTPERQERRTRNRERVDHGVWTPLRRSDPPHASSEHIPQSSQTPPKSHEGSNNKNFFRRGPAHVKDSGYTNEGKLSKRGGSGIGHSSHEELVAEASLDSEVCFRFLDATVSHVSIKWILLYNQFLVVDGDTYCKNVTEQLLQSEPAVQTIPKGIGGVQL